MERYCAWCGRFGPLAYALHGVPVICQSCLDAWIIRNTTEPAGTECVLDGCCGQGGAARGYAEAGHYVIGVDTDPDCRKGYLRSGAAEFVCGDITRLLADRKFTSQFTFAHYSPPCQHFSRMSQCRPGLRAKYPDLITPGRPLLARLGIPYVIENVGAARPWLRDPAVMCMWGHFGRETYRHRLIEAGGGFPLQPPPAPEQLPPGAPRINRECGRSHPVATAKAGHWKPGMFVSVAGHERKEPVRRVMEIDWMSNREAVAEAIPPYLAAEIARQLDSWRSERAAA